MSGQLTKCGGYRLSKDGKRLIPVKKKMSVSEHIRQGKSKRVRVARRHADDDTKTVER